MLSFLIPNPPVPAVPKEIVSASNKGILPITRKMISSIVKNTYIRYRIFAVDRTVGTSLLTEGPGLSAFIRFI